MTYRGQHNYRKIKNVCSKGYVKKTKKLTDYHKIQGTPDEYSQAEDELVCQRTLHYPAIHGEPKLVDHHQGPIP